MVYCNENTILNIIFLPINIPKSFTLVLYNETDINILVH